jgi:hypothetical protein
MMWPAIAVIMLVALAGEPFAAWLINNYRGWSQEWERDHE